MALPPVAIAAMHVRSLEGLCRLESERRFESCEGKRERKQPNLRCHFCFVFFDSFQLKLET